jgi:hypothetical protein
MVRPRREQHRRSREQRCPPPTGIPNLLVFAFFGPDQDPATAMINQLPQATNNAGFFTCQFTEPAGVSGVSYGAEWSITLENEDWLLVTDTEHIFSVPMDSSKKVPAPDGRGIRLLRAVRPLRVASVLRALPHSSESLDHLLMW